MRYANERGWSWPRHWQGLVPPSSPLIREGDRAARWLYLHRHGSGSIGIWAHSSGPRRSTAARLLQAAEKSGRERRAEIPVGLLQWRCLRQGSDCRCPPGALRRCLCAAFWHHGGVTTGLTSTSCNMFRWPGTSPMSSTEGDQRDLHRSSRSILLIGRPLA